MGCCFGRSNEGGDGEKPVKQDGCCMRCCRDTRRCVMSAECGRALQIMNVCAMCGMCLGMWT